MKEDIYQTNDCSWRVIALILCLALTFSIKVFPKTFGTGLECDSCKMDFEKLIKIKNSKNVSKSDLENCWQITSKLHTLRYIDYSKNDSTITHSLTRTFSDICLKSEGDLGVDYYLRYMDLTFQSVEEERSIGLERLFVKFPEIMLKKIGKNGAIMGYLAWGFVNNRGYGAKNPFENNDFSAMTFYENEPKPILNKTNCRAIFFETNPSLLPKYHEYKYQIDFIINSAIENLTEDNSTTP